MVVILKGATVFAADLLRSLSIPAELEFVRASSYGSATTSSGKVKLAHLVEGPLTGRHLLLVEDIVDSGRTINVINEELMTNHPASLRLATRHRLPAGEYELLVVTTDLEGRVTSQVTTVRIG